MNDGLLIKGIAETPVCAYYLLSIQKESAGVKKSARDKMQATYNYDFLLVIIPNILPLLSVNLPLFSYMEDRSHRLCIVSLPVNVTQETQEEIPT